jgi:hypothetical protein
MLSGSVLKFLIPSEEPENYHWDMSPPFKLRTRLIMTDSNDKNNPWLEGARALNEELKKQSQEVQEVARQLSRKTYPETWKALREREEETEN